MKKRGFLNRISIGKRFTKLIKKENRFIMKLKFDNDLHIHSKLSLCSDDPLQTCERILKYAAENNLSTICVTDHFWDDNVPCDSEWYRIQNYAHIASSKPLPQSEGNIKFLFGCETEMDKNFNIAIAKETFNKFDFVVIPPTHFHMTGLTIDEDIKTPMQIADFWVKKLNALLDKDLPFYKIGIAHLTCQLIANPREKYLETISLLNEADLESVFKKAAAKGVGIELNSCDMNYSANEKEIILRPYMIAKRMGCKFYFGSDAHHPDELDAAKGIFERAIDDLKLEEGDGFTLKRG